MALLCAVLVLLALGACGDNQDGRELDARDGASPVADARVECLSYEVRATECKTLCQAFDLGLVCPGAEVSDCVAECQRFERGTSYCPLPEGP